MSAEVKFDSSAEVGRIEKVQQRYFQCVTTVVTASAQYSNGLTPAVDTRLDALQDLYRLYRFVRCKVHMQPCDATAAYFQLFAYTPGNPTAGPTTAQQVSEMEVVGCGIGCTTVPVLITLGRKVLLKEAAIKWWQTKATGDTEIDTQGYYFFSTVGVGNGVAAANTCMSFWDVKVEFAGPLPAAVTFERQRKRYLSKAQILAEPFLVVDQKDLSKEQKEKAEKAEKPAGGVSFLRTRFDR